VDKVAAVADVKTLKVPGASIYYEVRGSGPVLLCIPGGPADAGAFRTLATDLASDYTVVTYDPRGLSHSPLEGSFDDDQAIEINAEDASRLISAVTNGKANVLASSGGAVISLELAKRHPDQVRTLIPHETPCAVLFPDPAEATAAMIDITDTYETSGLWAAFPKFAAHVGIRQGPQPEQQGEPTPEQIEGQKMFERNMNFWFGHTMRAIGLYQPDFEALKKGGVRIVSGVGMESEGEPANVAGRNLAKKLECELVVFAGGHGGFESHATEFAKKLRDVLGAA
jgi:pimeloyl-ACP methyl ester carboxylesterase